MHGPVALPNRLSARHAAMRRRRAAIQSSTRARPLGARISARRHVDRTGRLDDLERARALVGALAELDRALAGKLS